MGSCTRGESGSPPQGLTLRTQFGITARSTRPLTWSAVKRLSRPAPANNLTQDRCSWHSPVALVAAPSSALPIRHHAVEASPVTAHPAPQRVTTSAKHRNADVVVRTGSLRQHCAPCPGQVEECSAAGSGTAQTDAGTGIVSITRKVSGCAIAPVPAGQRSVSRELRPPSAGWCRRTRTAARRRRRRRPAR